MDFLSAFVMRNYEYPGQSPLWVFTYIFFGWIGMCGICLFLAEGILADHIKTCSPNPGYGGRCRLPP
jgi:hypothetical protein